MSNIYAVEHTEFPRLDPDEAAKYIGGELKKEKVIPNIVFTGAGFGYLFYNANMTRDEFNEEYEATGAYNKGISNIEKRLTAWGEEFRAGLSAQESKSIFLVGVDVGVIFSGNESYIFDPNGAQVALWIPSDGEIHVTWKCYPTNSEAGTLLCCRQDTLNEQGDFYPPTKPVIASHFHQGNVILVCHEFFSMIQAQGLKRKSKKVLEEMFLSELANYKKNYKEQRVFCLAHTISRRWNDAAKANKTKLAEIVGTENANVFINYGKEDEN